MGTDQPSEAPGQAQARESETHGPPSRKQGRRGKPPSRRHQHSGIYQNSFIPQAA